VSRKAHKDRYSGGDIGTDKENLMNSSYVAGELFLYGGDGRLQRATD
jgi:hypothetical protein